jgi:hypothetical protein
MKLLYRADEKANHAQNFSGQNYLIEKKPCSEKYKSLED